jgi:hypothetical protein
MIRILRRTARVLLVLLALFWFGFALLSGVEQSGRGIGAQVRNVPNALPWLALFVVVYIAFRWELAGGILIVIAGAASILFFNALAVPVVLLTVSVPLILLGSALILCWVLSRPQKP